MRFNYQDMVAGGKKPYVIAELGANHNGDMELAKTMIKTAKECGADCIKLQSFTKSNVFSKKNYDDNYFLGDDYRNRTDYTLESIVEAYALSKEQHYELKAYCDELDIDFTSTPFDKAGVDLLVDELHVPFIKVASMDVENVPFLKYIGSKGVPVVISTGLTGMDDVVNAIAAIEAGGCHEICVLHCVSIYPPADEQVNLNNIDMYRMAFGYPTGYSDHTFGVVAPIMSIAKNVCIIEKHFTMDKNMKGWDHKISANPEEMKIICDAAEQGYKMMGSFRKVVNESKHQREEYKRSIVAAHDLKKGHILTEEDLDYKRPGTAISPKFYEMLIGKELKRDIEADELFQWGDF
ncbi:N-acetylneuraminate synthase [Pseudobutyrivibrio sp. JW11]|uniref:N-acetylneuraminate synthase family protein n=1 Tax=Pseudobutyrivibrio sp. JW11 TaxID=1855302 RepID=UPI0008EC986C|nr:N-acetylneuraminate synthase family protein [Pseudobutyrivibrio sp. JW11]SFO36142.1 N-acetylneuraminate synthase [Pseudobutyrivibrio sp. JW11]